MLHDEQRYPDHMAFKPERWLDPNNPIVTKSVDHNETSLIDPWAIAFGYGRRGCPGLHLVKSQVSIAMTLILSLFEIRPKVDAKTGKPIMPEIAFTEEVVS